MAIKAVYDSIDDIPESIDDFRSLFIEKNGKLEMTGIQGVKNQSDIDRMKVGLEKERESHKSTKASLEAWNNMGEIADIQSSLDRIPELEAMAESKSGTLDDSQIQEAVDRRVEATIKSRMTPVERENSKLKTDLETSLTSLGIFQQKEIQRNVHDSVRSALNSEKILIEFHEDALMHADRVFEIDDENNVVTRDNIGVTPGMTPLSWLQDMQEKRPGWWPGSRGGGSRGSNTNTFSGNNPWSAGNWNATEQVKVLKEKGADKAKQMAEAAGSFVGSARPPAKKQLD